MGNKHYVVESGTHDERGVAGVFSSLEEARKYATEMCISYHSRGEDPSLVITLWGGSEMESTEPDRLVHVARWGKSERRAGPQKEMAFSIHEEPVDDFAPVVGKPGYRDEVYCVGTNQVDVLTALTDWITKHDR